MARIVAAHIVPGMAPGMVPVFAVMLVMGWAPSAQADPAKATAFFDRGTRLYQVGDYQQAIEQFKAGHIEEPDPSFVFNIAQCHRQLGHAKEALIGYRRFLAMDPDTSLRADVERKIAALEEVARGTAPAASVVPVSPLLPAPSARPVPPAPPLSSVPLAVDPGLPSVRASNKNQVVVQSPPPSRAARPARWRWPLLVGGVTTVLLAGSAAVLALDTQNKFDNLYTTCGQGSGKPGGCPDAEISAIRTRGHTVNVLWVLSGVAALGTGIGVYVGRDRSAALLSMSF